MSIEKSNEELVWEIRNGVNVDENKVQLYRQNMGIIHKYMKKFYNHEGYPEDFKDWESEAYFAVEKAIEKYNEERGSFTTCLGWQLMSTFCIYKRRIIGVPENVIENVSRCKRAEAEIEAQKGTATLAELSEKTGLSVDQVEKTKKAITIIVPKSLNVPVGEDLEDELVDFISDDVDYFGDVLEKIYKEDTSAKFWEILRNVLKPREYQIIRMMYYEGKSMSDIARAFGVIPQSISQTHKRIIKKLKYNSDLYYLLREIIE